MNLLEAVIFPAVDEINAILPPDRRLVKSSMTVLMGPDSRLDSVQLTDLILTVEDILAALVETPVVLIDDAAMARETSPFLTLATLESYLQEKIRNEL
jgi:hypothetical protein